MQEKFSLPVTTFLRQLLKTEAASRQQFLTSLLLCSLNLQQGSGLLSLRAVLCNIHYRSGLCMGSYYTASLPPPSPSAHPQPCQEREKAFYKMQSENQETESELKFTEVNHLPVQPNLSAQQFGHFFVFGGDLGFFQVWVWVFFFLWFWVLFGGGSFVLLWVVFTTRCSLHQRIILYASETMQPNCFNIQFMPVIG